MRSRGLTVGPLAIAWVRAKTPRYLPVLGARTRAQLAEAQMPHLDSER